MHRDRNRGFDYMGDRTTVYVHMNWLRSKLADQAPVKIVTVPRAGYRLDLEGLRSEMPGRMHQAE